MLCRGHAGGFLSGLLLAFFFGPRMVPREGLQKGKGKGKPGSLGLTNQPRLPWFVDGQGFTKMGRV